MKPGTRNTLFLLIISLLVYESTVAQFNSIATPYIKNYSLDDYKSKDVQASTQNWGIFQDEKGIMYFANTGGLLIFDGNNWSLINSNRNPTIRSVKGTKDNKVFVGAKRELGYITNNKSGDLYYKSLLPLIDSSLRDFTDVWNIYTVDDLVAFETAKKLYLYDGNKIYALKAKGYFTNSFKKNEILYLFDTELGLVKLSNNKLVPIVEHKIFQKYGFAINTKNNESIFVSRKHGFYKLIHRKVVKWDIPNEEKIMAKRPYCGVQIDKNRIAIGTQVGGIYIIDSVGNTLQIFNKQNGLQANTVYNLFLDRNKNLWAALGNGITYFKTNSPFTYFTPKSGIPKKNYTISFTKDHIYFGNEMGIHTKPISPITADLEVNKFSFVPNSGGQAISSINYNDNIIVAHNTGVLLLQADKIVSGLTSTDHVWGVKKLQNQKNTFYATTNVGLFYFHVNGNKLDKLVHIDGYDGPIRFAAYEDDYTVWTSDNIDGIRKLVIKKDLSGIESITHYTKEDGLPRNVQNVLGNVNGKIYILTQDGVYKIKEDKVVFASEISGNKVKYQTNLFMSDDWGRIWRQTDFSVMMVDNEDTITKPFNRFSGLDLSRINIISKNNIMFAGNKYSIHFNLKKQFKEDTDYFVQIRKIIDLTNNSLIIHGYRHLFKDSLMSNNIENNTLILPYKKNNIRFEYAASYYELPEETKYQVWIEGFDNNNMSWTYETKKDYTNLREGAYVFHVKAKNIYGHTSHENTFKFIILPPWYRTTLAYLAYIILSIALLWVIIRTYTRRLKKHNIKLEKIVKERTQEIETQKEEILTQTEKLEEYNKELQKLSVVASETDNAITIMNPEGEIEWVNKGFSAIYGYNFHEIKGKLRLNLQEESLRTGIKDIYSEVKTSKHSSTYESIVSAKSGKLINVNTTLTPVMNKSGEIEKMIAIDSDITKLKQAENEILQQREEILTQNDEIQQKNEELSKHRHHLEELVKERTRELETALKKAKESDRLKSSFLANMSHEIRTPMNAIIGYATLLEEEDDPANYVRHIQMIITNSNSLLTLVNNIIELSRFESGTVDSETETFIIDHLITRVYQSYLDDFNKKNIRFSIKKDTNEELEVRYDRGRLLHVLEQLLQNASKYTEKGEVVIGLKKNDAEFPGQLLIYVSDTGIGMKKEHAEKVFNQFMKIEENQEKLYRGTGIGLALCQRIIKMHNGKIWIESEENQGTTVFMTLPKNM